MTLRKIAQIGHPVLLRRAEPVTDPGDPETRALVADMIETMIDADGVGLAAPQVYTGRRVIIAREIDDRRDADRAPVRVLINPELVPLDGTREEGLEGCLSIPELRGLVPRSRRVGWRAWDASGRAVEGEAEGLFARILQHEVDHLDGILFLQRMDDMSALSTSAEAHHLQARLQPREEP